MKKKLLPEAFHPGKYIVEEMEERGWIIVQLAHRLKCTSAELSNVIYDTQPIPPEMAKALGDVFCTGAEVWLNIQAQYHITRLEQRRRKREKAKDQT